MTKKISIRAQRRKIERDLAKGKSIKSLNNTNLLNKIKYVLNETQATTLIKSFSKNKYNEIRGELLPKTYSEIRKQGSTFTKDIFIKEIVWYTKEILEFKEELNEFIKLENNFECNFLAGNYKESSKILEQIETSICVSQWSIEKKLLIAEYETGFKKNKEVLTNIIDKKNEPITTLLSKYQSIRIERNLSHFKYEEIILKLLQAYTDTKAKEYLSFKLDFFSQGTYKHKGFILNIENSSSIIDKYQSYITTVLLFLSEKKIDALTQTTIKECLYKLLYKINDVRVINALHSIGEMPSFTIDEKNGEFIRIIDLYSLGKYEKVIESLEHFLIINANTFELYELYIKSLINLDRIFKNLFDADSFSGQCLEDLYNIFCKNNKTQSSLVNSHKTFNAIGNTPWSYKYFAFIHSEHSSSFESINIHKYSHLNSQYFNPYYAIHFENIESANHYLSTINATNYSITTEFYKQICQILRRTSLDKITVEIEPFRASLYNAQALQAIGKFESALGSYQNLLSNHEFQRAVSIQNNKIEIVHGIFICLLNLNRIKDAVILVAKQNISNPNFSQKLRSDFLLKQIIESDDENLMNEISTPIVLHQYQSYINPNDIWIFYDNFLSSHGLDYPKELENIFSKLDKEEAIYFLKHICKQEVFDSSFWFEDQDELDNERIEICSILTRFDRENFEEYINEISDINRNILIRKGIKQMDESKIYVDVKGVKNLLKKDIKESFDRSMNLLNLSLDQIQKLDLESDNVVVPYYGKSPETNKIEFKKTNIKITSYSRYQQFLEMFFKIRDKFIASNEFGIDTYLSMRIRHGTLLGEIRSVFENNYLITKKEDNSNNYKANTYWKKNNLKSDTILFNKLSQILADFSKNIDTISNELKNKKLQIRTEKKESEGFFDYTFEDNELLNAFTESIGAIDDFDDFFDETINILWIRTELNLKKIREDISENIKDKMVSYLVNLSKDIELLINKNDYPEINELIRNITICQTDIKNELDKIAAWFKRTNSKTINEFYIQLPIDSTLTTLKRLFKDYNSLSPILKINCNLKFEGENFPHFCYIFQNLLHNIIEHSKLECNELKVSIEVTENANELTIIVENNFSEKIDLNALNNKIEAAQMLLLHSHDNDKIRAEEGTGYLKIQKTLKSDLSRESFSIRIHPIELNRCFKAEINFNLNNLQKLES